MRLPVTLPALSLACLLAACHHGGSCDEGERKVDVLDLTRSYYLYQDLLPSPVSLSDHAGETAQEFLDSLTATARAAGKDRGWSYLMAEDVYRRYAELATSVGFGLGLQVEGEAPSLRVLVKQVFAGSAAAAAGFVRGDELLAIGPDAAGLVEVAGLTAEEVSARLSAGGVAGVARAVRVLPRGGGAAELRTMTSADYGVDPVPAYWIQGGVGYVQLRTFIPAADAALREAFAAFQAAGVEGVVVDLRYNGGGYLVVAELLADLLGGGLTGKVLYAAQFNAAHAAEGGTVSFQAEGAASAFKRVAFVTTDASASAAELVPNALDAYPSDVAVAFVGARTYGKPVGQYVFGLPGCNSLLFLVSFRLLNAVGHADYFDGLPDAESSATLCPAADDLSFDQESTSEPSTAAAAYFAEHGACPPPAPGLRASAPAAAVDPLRAVGTPEALEMPGTF
jgi:carboxyl-terminal processing protease